MCGACGEFGHDREDCPYGDPQYEEAWNQGLVGDAAEWFWAVDQTRPSPAHRREELERPQPKRGKPECPPLKPAPAEEECPLIPPPSPEEISWEAILRMVEASCWCPICRERGHSPLNCPLPPVRDLRVPPPPAEGACLLVSPPSPPPAEGACLLVSRLQLEGEEALPPSQPEGEEDLPPSQPEGEEPQKGELLAIKKGGEMSRPAPPAALSRQEIMWSEPHRGELPAMEKGGEVRRPAPPAALSWQDGVWRGPRERELPATKNGGVPEIPPWPPPRNNLLTPLPGL
ncbi:UNVERIFIED_CONTAM: hypothetical protein FKN15_060459 [Acipenser sinensis]